MNWIIISMKKRRSSNMAGAVIEINESQFEQEVMQAEIPVLVDFWAPWCGPCKMLGPVLEAVAEANDSRLKVVKVNVDDNPNLAQKYEVMGIPTMFLFKNGQVIESFSGAMSKQALTEKVEKYI
jgi:thioredoxin 1